MGSPFKWLENWGESPTTDQPLRVIGIDLGTTISTVTEVFWTPNSDEPPLIQMKEVPQAEFPVGEKIFELVPSVVALLNDKEFVGWGAHNIRSKQEANPQDGKNVWSETKNLIGTRKMYSGAPEGYDTPRAIASKILKFLYEAVLLDDPTPIDRVVITVPASFQLTQRKDTVDAGLAAGIPIQSGDLMDEPVAAFLDFVNNHPEVLTDRGANQRMMVVDFGGGTTDVALLHIKRHPDGRVQVFRKGVSRFHRIGGSDLDNVIAHDVLLRDLLKQNDLKPFDLPYRVKAKIVLPLLAGTAEALKKNLSNLINNRIALGTFNEDDDSLKVSLPAPIKINTGLPEFGEITLSNPTLTLKDMEAAIAPFMRLNAHQVIQNEYLNINSIFAPIKDVLTRAEWTPAHVDSVLLVGGSSVFYGVERAIRGYLPEAAVYTYADKLDMQRCVGRGAASQALLLAAYGKSPLEMAMAENLTIQTQTGPVELVAANSSLPYPGHNEYKEITGFKVASGSTDLEVPLEVRISSGDRKLVTKLVNFQPPVNDGTSFSILLNVDSNMNAHFKIELHTVPGQSVETYVENPFSVVANPNEDRDKILEIEELLQVESHTETQKFNLFKQLAGLHEKLGEYEKARHYLEGLLPTATPDQKGSLLFNLGRLCGVMKDLDAQFEYYKASIELTGDNSSAFNLALTLTQQDRQQEALDILQLVFDKEDEEGTDFALRAFIHDNNSNAQDAREDAQKCVDSYPKIDKLTRFELHWLRWAANYVGNEQLVAAIDALRESNAAGEATSIDDDPGSGTDSYLPVRG